MSCELLYPTQYVSYHDMVEAVERRLGKIPGHTIICILHQDTIPHRLITLISRNTQDNTYPILPLTLSVDRLFILLQGLPSSATGRDLLLTLEYELGETRH